MLARFRVHFRVTSIRWANFATRFVQRPRVDIAIIVGLTLARPSIAEERPEWHFPEVGETLDVQLRCEPDEVGLQTSVIARLNAKRSKGHWALWRWGRLVHVEGDFNKTVEVKSLRKTWHALMVGAAIQQQKIKSVDEPIGIHCPELQGKDATATWRHVMTQTSGFDYPYLDHPAYRPGEIWTYSDKNPHHLCNALARVFGKCDYQDGYDDVARQSYFDAIGMRGWSTKIRNDGIRFCFDLEDMGRLGLLVVAGGRWNGQRIIPCSFVEHLDRKQGRTAKVNYDGPDDGQVALDPTRFLTAPYGFMTWVNTDGDYYPGADRAWAFAAGAGGSYVLWNRRNGIVFAGFGIDTKPASSGVPHILDASMTHTESSPVIDLTQQ